MVDVFTKEALAIDAGQQWIKAPAEFARRLVP
jgi:hypothetical protein